MSGVEGFAMVPNWLIRETEVSIYALSVFAALASHSGKGGIYPSQETLAVEARCSVRKVREALVELVDVGAVRKVRRSTRAGRLADGYELAVNGAIDALDQQPAQDAGSTQQPAGGAAATGTSEQIAPYTEEEPIEEDAPVVPTALADLVASPEDLFDAAWSHWPKKTEKKLSRERFIRALKKRPTLLADVAAFGRAYAQTTEVQFVPALAVWIGRERWDEPLPQRRGGGSVGTVEGGRVAADILRDRRAAREQRSVAS